MKVDMIVHSLIRGDGLGISNGRMKLLGGGGLMGREGIFIFVKLGVELRAMRFMK